jgi:hypothetical protein
MPWTDAQSSMIDSYDYDADMKVLHVKFHSGAIHSLQGVPPEKAAEFAAAPSKGKFFHTNLRDQHRAL